MRCSNQVVLFQIQNDITVQPDEEVITTLRSILLSLLFMSFPHRTRTYPPRYSRYFIGGVQGTCSKYFLMRHLYRAEQSQFHFASRSCRRKGSFPIPGDTPTARRMLPESHLVVDCEYFTIYERYVWKWTMKQCPTRSKYIRVFNGS